MTPEELERFNAADKLPHAVETQWHYPILIDQGFEAVTKVGIGFVRSYEYQHPDGREVKCTTGVNADYWSSSCGGFGYWSDLRDHLIATKR
jgi:hypothetical protein